MVVCDYTAVNDVGLNVAAAAAGLALMATTLTEVAAAVTFLLSPATAYITGITLNVDGASSLWRKTWAIPDHANAPSYDGFDGA